MGKQWSLMIILPIAILAVGCAARSPKPTIKEDEINLVWPDAPEKARIKYVRQFDKPADLGLRASFSRKLRDALVGSDDRTMTRPYAIATNGKKVVIADPGAAIIHVFNLERRTYRQLKDAGKQNFDSPIGVAFGGDKLYIADSVLNTIFILNERLKLSSTIENLQRPTSLAFDQSSQRLYVAETLAHTIRVFDKDGANLFSIGQRGEAEVQFNFPSHLAFANDRLFVNDTMNFRIQVFDPQGHHLQTFGKHGVGSGHLTQPKGVAVDAMGHVYVADALSNRVQIFKQDGTFLLAFGGEGDGPGTFQMPAGLAIWDDLIYVADSFNHRVQVFRYLREEG
jgi:sugar lactone lactonase YvrE